MRMKDESSVPSMVRQSELIQEIATEVAAAASESGEWSSCTLTIRRLAPESESAMSVANPSRDLASIMPPRNARGQIKELPGVMYQAGVGTWLSMELTVTRVGSGSKVDVSFDYDHVPEWHIEPSSSSYVRELRKYPRDEEHTPQWLREKIEQARIEYPALFDHEGSRGRTPFRRRKEAPAADGGTPGTPAASDILVRRDLPDLDTMRDRWAAVAAFWATVTGPPGERAPRAQSHGWYYDFHSGSWAQLILLPGERAVLIGVDRDYSETFREEVDMQVGLPPWARSVLPSAPEGYIPLWGLAYVYDDGAWWSRETGLKDGLDRLLPAVSVEEVVDCARDLFQNIEFLDELDEHDPRLEIELDPAAVVRAIALGPDLDEQTLRDVLVFEELDFVAGVAAARAFADVVPLPEGFTEVPYHVGEAIEAMGV